MTENRSFLSALGEGEPLVDVGIVSGRKVSFRLQGDYRVIIPAKGNNPDVQQNEPERVVTGDQTVEMEGIFLSWKGVRCSTISFEPLHRDNTFLLNDVTIGVGFHWQRKEVQQFGGVLKLLVDGDKMWAINRVLVEDYLLSVISSEMSGTSNLNLLCAHAVISRSWLLAQMVNRKSPKENTRLTEMVQRPGERIVWYDRQDHTLFDVCADDHCQRYQGMLRKTGEHVAEAIKKTRGQLLIYDNEICDARFSKCCGGALEEFSYCWEEADHPYLKAKRDDASNEPLPDLTDEATAEQWIRSAPAAYCNTHDRLILSQVLNDYDQETADFYRWNTTLKQEKLQQLLKEKLNVDLGAILALRPLERGKSGRISLLEIEGTQGSLRLGKELEIRRALSDSHLYSSAFVVDVVSSTVDGVPTAFRLTGAGWGHGVGLCQIGAAMMGAQGIDYKSILHHYYPNALINRLY